MTDPRSPLDQAVDLLVFAPLGLALAARDQLPKLIERGRSEGTSQVALARMLGQMAVGKGQQEARRTWDQLWTHLGNGGAGDAAATAASGDTSPVAAASPSAVRRRPSKATVATPRAPKRPGPSGGPAPRAAPLPPAAAVLAIPGYDALSAPQVVQRLSGLSPDELSAVGIYETATRHRQTILGRIAQLQSAAT